MSGILMALWMDALRETSINARLEIDYLESLVTDLEADLAQFDQTDPWMRRSGAAAATVLGPYDASPPMRNVAGLTAAVETAGWQYRPSITRNTIDDLRSTGNLRLIRDPVPRKAITSCCTTVENVGIPNANIRDRIWAQYDARVVNVRGPGERLAALQQPGSSGHGITPEALVAPVPESVEALIAGLKAFPELEVAAGEVVYQTMNSRAGPAVLRSTARELKAILEQRPDSGDRPDAQQQKVSSRCARQSFCDPLLNGNGNRTSTGLLLSSPST